MIRKISVPDVLWSENIIFVAKMILTKEISQLGRELRLHVSSPASFTHYIAFNIFQPKIYYGARGSYVEQSLTERLSPGREQGKESGNTLNDISKTH